MHIDKDLVASPWTPLVLAILAEDESYGYADLKRVMRLGASPSGTDGMLYLAAPSPPSARLRDD